MTQRVFTRYSRRRHRLHQSSAPVVSGGSSSDQTDHRQLYQDVALSLHQLVAHVRHHDSFLERCFQRSWGGPHSTVALSSSSVCPALRWWTEVVGLSSEVVELALAQCASAPKLARACHHQAAATTTTGRDCYEIATVAELVRLHVWRFKCFQALWFHSYA
jgi:hypothetical protein